MTWTEFYLVCFLVGFGLSIVAVLAGSTHLHLPHLHLHHGIHIPAPHARGSADLPWFNFGTIAAFLAWFGGTGYLLRQVYGVWFVAALGGATMSGLAGASLVFLFRPVKTAVADRLRLEPVRKDIAAICGRIAVRI